MSKSPESIQVHWSLERGENRSTLSRDDKASQGTAKVAHIHSGLSVPREREVADTLSPGAIQFQQATAKVAHVYPDLIVHRERKMVDTLSQRTHHSC
jgi:hypothetical protein